VGLVANVDDVAKTVVGYIAVDAAADTGAVAAAAVSLARALVYTLVGQLVSIAMGSKCVHLCIKVL